MEGLKFLRILKSGLLFFVLHFFFFEFWKSHSISRRSASKTTNYSNSSEFIDNFPYESVEIKMIGKNSYKKAY